MNKFAYMTTKKQALLAEEMTNEIKEVIYSYGDKVPLALAVGVLKIVEFEILNEA